MCVCVRAARPTGWRGSFRDGPRNCPPDVSEFGERERSTVLYRRKFPARGSILFFFFSIRRCGFCNEKSMSDTDILVDKEGIYIYIGTERILFVNFTFLKRKFIFIVALQDDYYFLNGNFQDFRNKFYFLNDNFYDLRSKFTFCNSNFYD